MCQTTVQRFLAMSAAMQALILESNLIEDIDARPETLGTEVNGQLMLPNYLGGQMAAWAYLATQSHMTEDVLLRAHALLMVGLLPPAKVGTIRTVDIWVGKKKFMPPTRVRPALQRWCAEMRTAKLRPFTLHRRLLDIHPFVDGNGRLSRLVWAWDCQRRGKAVEPMLAWLAREAPDLNFYQRRWVYYAALRQRVDDFGPSE